VKGLEPGEQDELRKLLKKLGKGIADGGGERSSC